MSIKVRPAESLWNELVANEKRKLAKEAANGTKRYAVAGASLPPPDSNPSNFKDLKKLAKYAEIYKEKWNNNFLKLNKNINKQNFTKLFKH